MSKIKIKNAIIQYPNLFEARRYKDGKPVFSLRILLSKKDHADTINEIKTLLKTICTENKIPLKPDSFKCFKDGVTTEYDLYHDYYLLNAKASETRRPKVVDSDLTPYTGDVKSGDIVNVSVSFWNYMNISKGIACDLKAVQITHEHDSKFTTQEEFNIEETFDKLENIRKEREKNEEGFDSLDDEIPF